MRHLIVATTFFPLLVSCATYSNMPMNVFLEEFTPRLGARYLTGTEATVAVNQSKCVKLTDHDIQAAIGITRGGDMQNGADELAGRIANAGGNAYVINGYRWLAAGGTATQLNINATSFLCD